MATLESLGIKRLEGMHIHLPFRPFPPPPDSHETPLMLLGQHTGFAAGRKRPCRSDPPLPAFSANICSFTGQICQSIGPQKIGTLGGAIPAIPFPPTPGKVNPVRLTSCREAEGGHATSLSGR